MQIQEIAKFNGIIVILESRSKKYLVGKRDKFRQKEIQKQFRNSGMFSIYIKKNHRNMLFVFHINFDISSLPS